MSQSSLEPEVEPPRLSFRVPPQPSHLLRARERLRDYLRQYCADGQVIDDVVLCVEEAATNAIRHSHSDRHIEISLCFAGGDLRAEVKDHGRGFDVTAFDREALPDLESDRGRGLFIVSKLMDSLELRLDGGLEVHMARRAASCAASVGYDSSVGDVLTSRLTGADSRMRAVLEEIDEGFVALDWEYRYTHLNEAMLGLMGRSRDEVLGKVIWELFPELGRSAVPEHCRAAMELGKPSVLEHHSLLSGDWFELRIYPTSAGISIYFRDINERKGVEAERRLLLGRSRLLYDVARAAAGSLDLEEICTATLRAIDQHLGLVAGNVWSLDPAHRELRQLAVVGYPAEVAARMTVLGLDDRSNNASRLLADDLPLLTHRTPGTPAPSLERADLLGVKSWLGLPIAHGETKLGCMALLFADEHAFDASEVDLFQSIAATLGTSLANARLYQAGREGQRRLTTLFDSMEEAVAIDELLYNERGVAVDWRITDVNAAWTRVSGKSREEAVGRTLGELYGAGAAAPFLERYARLIESGEAMLFEQYFSPTNMYLSVSAFHLGGHRFATLTTDITERKRAEEELERLADLLDLSFEPIIVWRLGGTIEAWNRGATELYGYSADEALRQVTHELLLTTFPQPWAAIEDALRAHDSWEGELALHAKDGSKVVVLSRLQLVVGNDGVERILESHRDISERRLAEEALRKSEENARLLADVLQKSTMPFGMGAPDGRLVLFNEAFERLTGYSGAELKERALTWSADLTPPEWRATEAAILAQAVSERRTVSYEKEYLRKDGTRVPIELLVQPIFDESGSLLHYRSFLTDISERKQAEQRLLERATEAARLEQGLPGNRTTRLVARFRGHRWRLLVGAIAIQSAILLALNSAQDPRHILGLPGSLIALITVLAGALAGPLVGALVAAAGGGVFYYTVGGQGSQSTLTTTVMSTAIWMTAGLLSGFLAKSLGEQAARRREAAVALVRTDAAREAQLAEQARIEELARRLQLQTENLRAAGEELSAQRDELHERALENERLYKREAEAASLAAVLNEMNGLINSTLDGREIMQTVVEQAVAAVGADSAMVALRHGDDWVAEYGYPEVPGVIHESVRSDEAPFMIAAVRQRRPIAIDDCDSDPRCNAEVQRRFGVRSVLCLPLIVKEEVLGVIFFNHHKAAVAFAPAIVEFADRLATSISTALANAQLYEEQQRIATTLQENFLHELPTVAGLELGMVTKTAFEPELVGGDFSDVFVVDDGHVVVLIGDVAGKGVRAAGLTETVRSTVRALAAVDPSPAFILGKANELLMRYDPDEGHVTAFCAMLEPHTGHLNYASAGHPAPVHLGAFTCRTLDVTFGPPLGTFQHPYTSAHAILSIDDYLVLYTDGVTEARRGAELLGEQRLIEVVTGLRGRSAQDVAEGVRDAALAFAGRLRDDLQVVALRLA